VGRLNPFRYRGYCYDEETGFYYVSTRYYDPEVGRFISADTTDILGVSSDLYDKNLYAYCDNNPIIRVDTSGELWEFVVAGAVINVVTTFCAAKITGQSYSKRDLMMAAVAGGVNALGKIGPIINGVISGLYAGITSYRNDVGLWESILSGGLSGVLAAASISNLANAKKQILSLGINSFVDFVFGTGYNSISASVYKTVNDKGAFKKNNTSASTKTTVITYSYYNSNRLSGHVPI